MWADSVNVAAMTSPQRTWTGRVERTTVQRSAATTETVCAAPVSAKRETTPRIGTAASTASVTTSTVIALETNCVEVSVTSS